MRTLEKKKAWLAVCREKVRSGLINDHDGGWKAPSQLSQGNRDADSGMVRDMRNGYKVRQ